MIHNFLPWFLSFFLKFLETVPCDMKVILSLTFHASCAVIHVYVLHWLMFKMGLKILEMASFFTVWTTTFHAAMFLALSACDTGKIFNNLATKDGDSSRRSSIVLENEGFLTVLGLFLHVSIVMSVLTQFVFWLLFYIDGEMILPEAAEMPSSLNHMMHTFPLFLALLTVNTFASNFPSAREERSCRAIARTGVKFIGFVVFAYLTLIWILFELKGVWPYPFMFSYSRVDYFIFSLCFFGLTIILSYLCSFIETKVKNIKIW